MEFGGEVDVGKVKSLTVAEGTTENQGITPQSTRSTQSFRGELAVVPSATVGLFHYFHISSKLRKTTALITTSIR